MENSFLNMAHVHSRKAEHHTKHRRFDEAIDNHRKAASYIDEALKTAPQSPVVLESLQLQRKYHLKQVDFLRHKKQQYERYMKALEYQRKRNPEFLSKQLEKLEKHSELQLVLYKNLDDTDSLLETMTRSSGDSKLVEDLISLNQSLHVLVHRITQSIDDYATENEMLKEKLSMYEKETEHHSGTTNAPKSSEKRIPSLETGKDALERGDFQQEELAALAPLELPTFDMPEFENN